MSHIFVSLAFAICPAKEKILEPKVSMSCANRTSYASAGGLCAGSLCVLTDCESLEMHPSRR